MFLEFMRCPACDAVIGDGDRIYTRDGKVIGCEMCICEDWADSEEEADEEEMFADHCDFLNDMAREERMLGI